MPLGFLVGGCCGGTLLPFDSLEFVSLDSFGFPFTEADAAPAFFTSVFLLAIDSDPGRSVPNWSFYAKSALPALAHGGSLSTTLVRSAVYAFTCGSVSTGGRQLVQRLHPQHLCMKHATELPCHPLRRRQ